MARNVSCRRGVGIHMPGFHIAGIDVTAARGCIFGLFTFTLQTKVSARGGCGYQMRALQPFDVQIPATVALQVGLLAF